MRTAVISDVHGNLEALDLQRRNVPIDATNDATIPSPDDLVGELTAVHILIFSHTRFRLPIDAALMGPAALSLSLIHI